MKRVFTSINQIRVRGWTIVHQDLKKLMLLCVGIIVYSGAQMCAPEDNLCLYMQKIGEAVKVSFYETHHNVFSFSVLFVCQSCG